MDISPPIAAIIAATIAGFVSLVGLIIAKENKTSEFRQAWIDSLRSEVADLVAQLSLSGLFTRPPAGQAFSADFLASTLGFNRAIMTIRLRLNATERPSKAILETLDDIEAFLRVSGKAGTLDSGRLIALIKALQGKTSRVLKEEWVRVRTGEPAFTWAKRLIPLAVGLTLIFVLTL